MRHTRGPWKIGHGCLPGDAGFSVISNNSKANYVKCVAESWPCTIVNEDHRIELFANARLIAAAPDLLTTLIEAIERSGFSVSGPTDSRAAENGEPAWVCRAREVIADATR